MQLSPGPALVIAPGAHSQARYPHTSAPAMRLFAQDKRLYQSRRGEWTVEVFEKEDRRELRFGNHIVQSAFSPQAPDLLVLEYTRAMLAAMVFKPQPGSILHLGLGAGSIPRFIHRHWPNVKQRVIEINPDVIEAAYKYFDVPVSRRLHISEGDAKAFLAGSQDVYDMMFVDLFVADAAAAGFDDPEFLASQRRHLSPAGWLVHNAWGSDREGLSRLGARLGALYPCMYALSVRAHSNVILICGASGEVPPMSLLTSRAAELSRAVPFDFTRWPGRMRPSGAAQRKPNEAWIARA